MGTFKSNICVFFSTSSWFSTLRSQSHYTSFSATMKRTRSQTKAAIFLRDQTQPILPPLPQTITDSGIATKTSTTASSTNSSSAKISFRARKFRRLASDSLNKKGDHIPNTESSSKTSTLLGTTTECTDNQTQFSIAKPLTFQGEIDMAHDHLRNSDSLLATLIDTLSPPDLNTHGRPFLSLTKGIICQQLSNKAAKTINNRFVSLCGGEHLVLPEVVLGCTVQQLREVGISRQKVSYLLDLSSKYRDGVLSDSSIVEMDDDTLFTTLTMVKGIGPWSVHMFMIFTLHRPDVLPVGDLVVRRGVQRLYGLKELPLPSQMEKLCEKWKPYRSVGSWYMYRLVEAQGFLPTAKKGPAKVLATGNKTKQLW